jgi:hypothetical protein
MATTVENQQDQDTAKSAAINALAVVGFIALLIIGIMLAIYSARYIPVAVSKISGIAQNNSNTNGSGLAVVTSSSTLPFSGSAGSIVTSTTTTTLIPPSNYTAPAIAPVEHSTTKNATSKSKVSSAPKLYGLPDLAVTTIATGYLAGPSTSSFVPASIVPPGAHPAVEFSIANDGTNVTGPWNFLAEIPSYNNGVFNSPIEPSLNPGDHTVFTLGFNNAIPGPAQTITVIADPNNTIAESNEGNNSAAAAVTILQTGS